MKASQLVQIAEGDYQETLRRCGGLYITPKNAEGKRLGPLVGYAGKYELEDGSKRQYIGEIYSNFAMIEEYPHVLDYFAQSLVEKITATIGEVDYVLGPQMGGVCFGLAVARHLDTRFVFAEKKVTSMATQELRQQEVMEFLRHEIKPGSKVLLIEDVCNNFSTTAEIIDLVASHGSEIVAIGCAMNYSKRQSYEHVGKQFPVVGLMSLELVNLRQDDPSVIEDVQLGNLVLKAKNEWPRLMQAMESAQKA